MKKLFVLSVFVLFGLFSATTFAQVEEEKALAEVQDATEVKLSELPEAITKSVKGNFSDYTLKKAAKVLKQNPASKKNEAFYNVTLVKGKEVLNVLFDAKGNELKKAPSTSK